MQIRDSNISRAAAIATQRLIIPLVTAISQTGVVAFKYTPGYKFRVTRVRTYARTKAGTVSGNCKISTRTAAALTFTTATEVAQTLSSTDADLKGSATDALSIEFTSDGSGVLTNGVVVVEIRPQSARGS